MSERFEVWTIGIDEDNKDYENEYMSSEHAWVKFQEIEWLKHLKNESPNNKFDVITGFHIERQSLYLVIHPNNDGTFNCSLGLSQSLMSLKPMLRVIGSKLIKKDNVDTNLLKKIFLSMFEHETGDNDRNIMNLMKSE